MAYLSLSTDLKNIIANTIANKMAGTMGTGGTTVITIYNGAQPATADYATNGTMLCQIIKIGWGGTGNPGTIGATGGTANVSSAGGFTGTASTTGVASWARMETFGTGFTGSAATFRIDGDCGTAATCAFVINSTTITALGSVTLVSCPILLP